MNVYTTYRKGATAVLVAALALAWAGQASATPEVQKQVGEFARDIKKFLDQRGEKAVTLGEFNGPPQLEANPGPGLIQMLGEELKKLGVEVKGNAKLGITGEFRPVIDEESKGIAVELKVKIVNSFNRPLQVFSCGILGAPEIAQIIAFSAEIPVTPNVEKRRKAIEQALEKAQLAVEGTKISNGPGSPYAVEVLVSEDPKQPEMMDGRAFVPLERGEIYAIRLHNRSNRDAAVLLAIDGINVFAFNEDADPDGQVRKEFHVIVPKGGSSMVKGWYRAKGQSDSFLVTGYPESAVKQLGLKSSSRIGQITAVFKACWPKDQDPPPEEGRSLSGNATGFGPPVEERYVRLERAFGMMRAAIAVRYNKK